MAKFFMNSEYQIPPSRPSCKLDLRGVDARTHVSSSLKSYVYKCMNSLNEINTFLSLVMILVIIISNLSFYRNSAFFCWIFFSR